MAIFMLLTPAALQAILPRTRYSCTQHIKPRSKPIGNFKMPFRHQTALHCSEQICACGAFYNPSSLFTRNATWQNGQGRRLGFPSSSLWSRNGNSKNSIHVKIATRNRGGKAIYFCFSPPAPHSHSHTRRIRFDL